MATHHGAGRPLRRADTEDGVALKLARKRKVARYPELCRADGRARLVVIAGEVGGRWRKKKRQGRTIKKVSVCVKASRAEVLRWVTNKIWRVETAEATDRTVAAPQVCDNLKENVMQCGGT